MWVRKLFLLYNHKKISRAVSGFLFRSSKNKDENVHRYSLSGKKNSTLGEGEIERERERERERKR